MQLFEFARANRVRAVGNSGMHIARRRVLFTCVVILAAVVLRAPGLSGPGLWFDEAWSAFAAGQSTPWAAANADATNPPLYYALLQMHAAALGQSEFALRLFSLWCGLLLIPLCVQLGRRLLDENAGLLAGAAAAALPLLSWASQEARMYTLLACLAAVAALALHRVLTRPTRAAWGVLWGAELALLYAHNTGPVAVLWLNLAALLAWLASGRPRRPLLWRWIAGQIGVGALWLPYFLSRFVLLPAANSAQPNTLALGPEALLRLWRAFWELPWERVLHAPLAWWTVLALLALALLLPWRRAGARWAVLHALAWCAGIAAGLLVLGNEFHGRYLVVAAPFVCVLAGAAAARALRWRWAAWPALLALAVPFAVGGLALNDGAFPRDDSRGMAAYYARALGPEDSVLAWSYADRYDLAYYWPREGVSARRITLPEGAEMADVLPLLPRSGALALNVWYTQRADFRGMLPCLLEGGSSLPPDRFQVTGMASLLYRQPGLREPVLDAADIRLGEGAPLARITALGRLPAAPASAAWCLPLALRMESAVTGALKAAVTVRGPLGDEIARADAVFATANQRTTAQAAPGETLTAWALLRLPYGAPPARYPVFVRVYDEGAAPSGYPIEADRPALGRDLPIGDWLAQPGAEWPDTADFGLPHQPELPLGGLTLAAHDLTDGALRSGDALAMTLLWRGAGDLPALTLADSAGRWSVQVPAESVAPDAIRREWRRALVPADAPDGVAELRLPDGTVLARYPITALPLTTALPAGAQPIDVVYPLAGALAAVEADSMFSLARLPTITLYWRGPERAPSVSYTAFVQMIDAAGQVAAQSDALPAAGARPTTGWRPGEIIADAHMLRANAAAAPGPVTLIAGLYDAATGERLRTADGADHVVLGTGTLGP
jgi:4-amino-4-deoxy-L-arabinose transferase-like glycosyltransferase